MQRALLLATFVLVLSAPARADVPIDVMIRDLGLKEADAPLRADPKWTKPKKVVVVAPDAPQHLASLQAVAPGVEVIAARSPEAAMAAVKDADGLIAWCSPALVKAASNLRWMHAVNAGVEPCVGEEAFQSGRVLMTNMQRVAGSIMAESVIATMLAMTRGLPYYIRAQDREEFVWGGPRGKGDRPPLIEVKGRTILVVGLGGIGTEVARRAHGLGMKVIATRNSSTEGPDFVSYVGKSDELLTLTPQADVVVNTVPLTKETRDLFDEKFFARMKKEAYFINVGRGESVKQEALIAALNDGRIAGAALDVMTPEPLPKGHPLWKARNLLITPHSSAAVDENRERWPIVREQLRRYAAGEKMLSVVDPRRGY